MTCGRPFDAANGSDVVEDWEFRWISAELMFCRVFRGYVEDVSRAEVRSERLNRLVADVARTQGLDVRQTMRIRSEMAVELDDHEAWFNRYRQHFLLLDRYPENEGRFQLHYRDCMQSMG